MTAADAADTAGAGSNAAGADPGSATSCGLLIRMWLEPGSAEQVRARVLTFEGSQEPSTWATAAGEAAVLDAVDRWIREHVPASEAPSPARPPALSPALSPSP